MDQAEHARRCELEGMSKARLLELREKIIRERGIVVWTKYAPHRWQKACVISSIIDLENIR